MIGTLSDFCRSAYEAYDGEEGDMPKRKEAEGIKQERYSPWAADREHGVRTESPPGADHRDVYNTEQLVPAPASYQPQRYCQLYLSSTTPFTVYQVQSRMLSKNCRKDKSKFSNFNNS